MPQLTPSLTSADPELMHQRRWSSGGGDSGSVHALGNGLMLAYATGANLFKIQGPPYTAPSVARLVLPTEAELAAVSSRERRRAIWHHRIERAGRPVGEIVDFVDAELPVLVRRLTLTEPLDLVLGMPHAIPNDPAARTRGLLALVPSGSSVYRRHVCPNQTVAQFVALGEPGLEPGKEPDEWLLRCPRGETTLMIVGGPDYPACVRQTEEALAAGADAMLARTRRWWDAFAARRAPTSPNGSAPELLDAIDDTAVIIKSQQAREGCVVAGYPYVLGYVRDQYGVARGLLALGYTQEARQILACHWTVFQRYGFLRNAQAAGLPGLFHRHENDDVELTGYLLVQAFDYLRATDDDAFVREIRPMLRWALEAQARHLVEGMLPFNGDETYIAGGTIPRTALQDGSSEATLLFIEGATRYLQWTGAAPEDRERFAPLVTAAKDRFLANFWKDGRLVANNPRLAQLVPGPRFRHGVCLADPREKECGHFGWTQRGEDGRFRCPACHPRRQYIPHRPAEFFLPSIAVTPLFVGSNLLSHDELRPMIHQTAKGFEESGALTESPNGTVPGYEPGVLLVAMQQVGHPAEKRLRDFCLGLRDDTGAWVEYYRGTQAVGTRYRPWESALNLLGLLGSR